MFSKRHIDTATIRDTVKNLCLRANTILRPDVLSAIKALHGSETNVSAKNMLDVLIKNAEIAQKEKLPLCQDTGMVAVFMEIGEDVILNGNIEKAVNDGVRSAYEEGGFRRSVVGDPLLRDNTGTNTPAVLHIDHKEGSQIEIFVMPKGFGSENKSRTIMLDPTAGEKSVVEFCVEAVKLAGPDACPPYVLGVGLGGTSEHCALLAKKALLRPIGEVNPKEHLAALERAIKEKTNDLNIGIMGLGGNSTVMSVAVEAAPTHIAGLPVAVNISCHALRSAGAII